MKALILPVGLLGLVLALTGTAQAQEPRRDPAAAEALFAEGKRLMAQKNLAQACPKFEESHRLDPGVGALLNLAACQEQRGKIASAWGHYRDAEQQLRRDADPRRAAFAQGRAEALQPRLPKVVITVEPQAEGFTLTRDGVVLSTASFGTPLPVDPGPHDLVAEAPGHISRTVRFEAKERQIATVTVGALDPDPRPPAPMIGPVADPMRPPDEAPDPDRGSTQRTVGLVLGATGVASMVVGGIFVGLTASNTSSADEGCPTPTTCSDEGFAAVEDARTTALVADITLIGGVALAAAGAVVYLTAPSPDEPLDGNARAPRRSLAVAPLLGRDVAGVSARGRF